MKGGVNEVQMGSVLVDELSYIFRPGQCKGGRREKGPEGCTGEGGVREHPTAGLFQRESGEPG